MIFRLFQISYDPSWKHLSGIRLADPKFGLPGRIDLLLGVDVFTSVMLQGRRCGSPDSPTAFETEFGWVLAGNTMSCTETTMDSVVTHHVTVDGCDDILRKFWEVEENKCENGPLTTEEKYVSLHFKENHYRLDDGAFVVPLPRKQAHPPIGESRSQAVRRFIKLEQSLHSRSRFEEFGSVVSEYFELNHAEVVPKVDLEKSPSNVFYLPMHAVRKDCSTTTKLRVVFDASAKSSTGVSLNNTLLVGHTVHSTLIDVLLRFRLHRVALIIDVSKMYRAIRLDEPDKDLHRFVWRKDPKEPLVTTE